MVMNDDEIIRIVKLEMGEFARITGLDPISPNPKRYLWTDAFAVCNFLELYRRTEDRKYLDMAIRLVDQVHHVLGRHRLDDPRKGWISGKEEIEGERHPTAGGLRIGKELNERKQNGKENENLEWEQDGQYYHYLTKWMHALNRVWRVTSDPKYSVWAIELAQRANSAFTYPPPTGGRKRMYWKMSIDLSYPLVTSMGQHDALDGFVTYNELRSLAPKSVGRAGLDLDQEIKDVGNIMRMEGLPTDDTLGMGGLLMDAARVAQIESLGGTVKAGLLEAILDAALISIESFSMTGNLELGAGSRLAFRELGLSIGLKGVPMMEEVMRKSRPGGISPEIEQRLTDLERYSQMGQNMERFWTIPINQKVATWSEHREINMVMLATSLAPESFLSI